MLLFLIFALIMVSGLIAYLGDQIGMKVGKKRLSIFGIRPKYTSIIITILTGIFIATISISLLLIASEDVRLAVFNMQELVSKLQFTNRELNIKDVELTQKTDELVKKDETLKNMKEEIDQTTIELDNIRVERDSLKENLADTEQQYKDTQDKLAIAQKQYTEVSKAKTEYEEATVTLQNKLKELEDEKKQLENDKQSLQKDISNLEKELDKLTNNMKNVLYTAAVNILQSQIDVDQYQNKDIVFRKGDTVYMESLPTIPEGSSELAEKAVDDFLERANQHVAKMNLLKESTGRSIKFADRNELLEVARQLVNPENEKILVAIYASKNILVGEYLDAKVEWRPNTRVFKRGETIYEKIISSDLAPGDIFNELANLLDKVSNLAIQRDMLSDDSGSVGTFGYEDFYNLTETIRKQTGNVKITVQASKDIWKEDTLSPNNLNLYVSPVGVGP